MGKVINNYKISSLVSFRGPDSIKEMIDNHISQVLSVMPIGTKHISTSQENTYSTFIPFTIIFEHPLFEDGTVLELRYKSDCYVNKDNIEQLRVFTGLNYIKPDGTPRYNDNL